jgi:hypothetical protein
MDILNSLVEVELKEEDDFLKVKETLTRIGISSKKDKTLYQSCHILHKRGKYYIVHFKELFALDGKNTDYFEQDGDKSRRNTIAKLLSDWGLVKLVNADIVTDPVASMNQIKVISFREKNDWHLVAKYDIGKK